MPALPLALIRPCCTWMRRCAGWFALAVLLALPLASPGVRAAEPLLIERALAVAADTPHFPTAADAPAEMVALPDEWRNASTHQAGPVWYRVAFDAPAGAAPADDAPAGTMPGLVAAYIERACANLEVQLNGDAIFGSGNMTDPVTRDCAEPHLITLPAALLKPQDNVLDIKVAGYPLAEVSSRRRAGGLSAVRIGPAGGLTALWRSERLLRITVPQLALAGLVPLGACLMLLGWQRRRHLHLTWLGALCLAWALTGARLWLSGTNTPNHLAELLITSFVPVAALCAVQFVLSLARWRHNVVDVALLVQCLMVPASMELAGEGRQFVTASAWYVLLGLEVVGALGWYLYRVWPQVRADVVPVALLLATGTVCASLEILSQQGMLEGLPLYLGQLVAPLALMLIGARQLLLQGRQLHTAEAQRDALERRIYETAGEAERNYAQMVEIRVEQVTQQERKRIAADLHDDLGAKLLTIVHTSDNERISSLAREALEEMRLSVRGLTGKPVRLIDALGDWRAEVVARLAQASVEGEWSAPHDEVPQTLSARAYVQTTRILREAVSNVIKHSGASQCKISCKVVEGDFRLVIQDNGNGIPMELDGRLDRGHGMSSMKHRAKQIHGQCLVESGPGYGTVIRLTLPLGA